MATQVFESPSKAESFFRIQLERMHLGRDEIKRHVNLADPQESLRRLEESLRVVNEVLKNPAAKGLPEVEARVGAGEATVKVSPLPILYRRQRLILELFNQIKGQQNVTNLRELIAMVEDPHTRQLLTDQLKQIEEDSARARNQADEVDTKLFAAEEKKLQLTERRANIIRPFLERESVATLLGAVLLVILVLILTIGGFAQITLPEVLSNAFLVILGYFFGQSAKQEGRKSGGGAP